MAEIKLNTGVFQDGGQFYHEEFGLIADYGDQKDFDMEAAFEARRDFHRDHPEHCYVDLSSRPCLQCGRTIESAELCAECAKGNDPFKSCDNTRTDLRR